MACVLIVEDDQNLLDLFSQVLKGEGHKVITAVNGQEALNKVKNEDFDLIITDLNMPKVSGRRLVEVLEEKRNLYACPIIIASGEISGDDIKNLSSNSRFHFLPKPISKHQLIDKVRRILTQQPVMAMDVRFVNPVLQAVVSVIKNVTELEVTVGKPYIKKAGELSGDISGIVGVVSSGFKGTIALSFSDAGFLKVLSKMLHEDCPEITDENKDAVAELLNIIFGHAKKTLNEEGMNIQPAIPTIVRGKGHTIEHSSRHPTIVIPFSANGIGEFRSEVSFNH